MGEPMTQTRDPVPVIAVMLGWLLWILFGDLAHAHDPKHPDLDNWYKGLNSAAGGYCCDGREARSLDGSDWETKDAHYRVRLDGNWYDVPENAVVKERNLAGRALVWVHFGYTSSRVPTIRCFLPGTMT
jgi:hypothetical protein